MPLGKQGTGGQAMSEFYADSATASLIRSVASGDQPGTVRRAPHLRLLPPPVSKAEVPDAWWPILLRLGLAQQAIGVLLRRADANGTSFQTELFSSGVVDEACLCREIARVLDPVYAHLLLPPVATAIVARASASVLETLPSGPAFG